VDLKKLLWIIPFLFMLLGGCSKEEKVVWVVTETQEGGVLQHTSYIHKECSVKTSNGQVLVDVSVFFPEETLVETILIEEKDGGFETRRWHTVTKKTVLNEHGDSVVHVNRIISNGQIFEGRCAKAAHDLPNSVKKQFGGYYGL